MAKNANLANAQDLVNIEEIRENAVMLKGNGLRQVIMVGGLNFSLKSEDEQDIITQGYQNFLNSLDFPLQIIIHSRKINIEKYLSNLDGRRGVEISPLLQSQIGEYEEFIRGFVQENDIMAKTFLVVVPFTPIGLPSKESAMKFLPFLKKNKDVEQKMSQEKQADFKANLGQLSQRASEVVEGIRSIGLEAKILDDEELIELFYNFYNPETIEKEKMNLPNREKATADPITENEKAEVE
jgi:hypothetical protein